MTANNVSRVLAIFTGAYSCRANCCCTFKPAKRFDKRRIGGGRWALIVRDSVNKKAVENRPGLSEGIKKAMLYSYPDGCFWWVSECWFCLAVARPSVITPASDWEAHPEYLNR